MLAYRDFLFLLLLIRCSCSSVYMMVMCVCGPRWAPKWGCRKRFTLFYWPDRSSVSSLHTATHAAYINASEMMFGTTCRMCMTNPLYFLNRESFLLESICHICHCTIAALSQCVMFSNRFVKWMEVGDSTNNEAPCFSAICYMNVPLMRARGYEANCEKHWRYQLCFCTSTFNMSLNYYTTLHCLYGQPSWAV